MSRNAKKIGPVDLICGGFPCQPFSHAGKRNGTADDRYLWPEMLRVIREVKPTGVVGENVAGLLSMDGGAVFEEICSSLETEGYAVEAFVLPAISRGAPHRRDRVWITANRSSESAAQKNDKRGEQEHDIGPEVRNITSSGDRDITHWSEHWYEAATRLCRISNGLSRGVDRSKRLKALGNAIVPQVVYEIFNAIEAVNRQ